MLQPLPRGLFRFGATRNPEVLRWMVADTGMPAPGLLARANRPVAVIMARAEGADEERIRADLAALPTTLDHVDELIAEGTVGGDQPNAADFQILTTIRVLAEFTDLKPYFAGRPQIEAMERLVPKMPGPIPAWIPPDWLAPLPAAQATA